MNLNLNLKLPFSLGSAGSADGKPYICQTNCAIATVFLVSMIYRMFSVDKSGLMKNFNQTLNSALQSKYKNIILERRNIYLKGYAIGFVVALAFVYYQYTTAMQNKRKTLPIPKIPFLCTIAAITFTFNYFYYILHPKSDWMVMHLKTPQQRDAWLKVYRHMQMQCHLGFALGIVAVVMYANSVCMKA